jgi:putative serine protease PepD
MDELTSDRFRAPAPGDGATPPAGTPFVGAPVNLPRRITTPIGPAPTLPPAPPPSYNYTAPSSTYSYTAPPMPYPAQAAPAYIAPPTERTARPARKGGFGPALLTGTLALGLIMGSVGGGVTAWYLDHNGTAANPNNVTITTAPPAPAAGNPAGGIAPSGVADGSSNAIGTLYNKVANSVVSIHTTETNAGPMGGGGEGTGIVVDQTHILTNYHVVQGSDTIRIVLIDGSSVMGKLAGSAPQDDLAVVTADLPADKVTPAVFGDSSAVKVGDEVVAIGDPFGLDHSVTAGIISAVNRDWQTGGRPMRGMIQTDAPINPGNSGGPLFNLQGQVIGITTSIESPVRGSVGVGFAIPSNRATSLLPQLSGGAKVQRPWLGISGQAIDDEVASQ